jgi:hypothetical protein
MIGPGWMPSRPRPRPRPRMLVLFYPRRQRGRRSNAQGPAATQTRSGAPRAKAFDREPDFLRLDGAQAELPVATLRPSASQPWHRALAGALRCWLAQRWAWIVPRSVPMLVAFAGLVAVLGATKYLSVYACGEDPTLQAPVKVTSAHVANSNPTLPSAAPQLPHAECVALVQTLPDSWPGPDHGRPLHLRSHAEPDAESALRQPDACSLATVGLR